MAVDSSKTEKATPKKREDERKKGNVFQSRDVVSALSILALFFMIKILLPFIYEELSATMTKFVRYVGTVNEMSMAFVMDVLKSTLIVIALTAGPIMLTGIAISILATGVQTRFRFSKENLKFKFSRINPIQGFKKLFSIRSITELLKAAIKITIIGYILFQAFMKIYGQCIQLMYNDVLQATVFILNTIMDLVIQLSIAFIAIAAFDYLYQWWDYERNIRMSKQEVKEEYKQLEGDPQIKSRIKERQRKISMQRMMQQVPTADVIIRNPTHFAVALKYSVGVNNAPVVVAKGQDFIALRIIEIAEEHHIPMKEDKPLARALYGAVEVNREIPPEYYSVLAEILAWVYSMKKETRAVEDTQ